MAGMAGLEPTISESKSGVLPLHYIPKFYSNATRFSGFTIELYKKFGLRPLRGAASELCHMGWEMGLEPTTPGTTIRCSAN